MRIANCGALADTGLPQPRKLSRMDRTQSKTLAALWVAGWLFLMVIIAVAGREVAREISVFQLSEMR